MSLLDLSASLCSLSIKFDIKAAAAPAPQASLKRTRFLWQLHHLRRDYVDAARARAAAQSELAALQGSQDAAARGGGGSTDEHLARLKKRRLALVRKLDDLKVKREKQVRCGGGAGPLAA